MAKRMTPLPLHMVEATFRRGDFPVAGDIDDWIPLFDLLTSFKQGDQWLGYKVALATTLRIKHPVYFMGSRMADRQCGYFSTVELVGEKGAFKLSMADVATGSRGKTRKNSRDGIEVDVRATSQEFMDLIFIVAKSSI